MVEAAGIEPASEKDYRREPTCLVHSLISTADWERTSRPRSSSIDLGCKAMQCYAKLPKATSRSFRAYLAKRRLYPSCEPGGQDGYLALGSVCKLHIVGSCCVPIVLGVLGAPHASQQQLRFRRILFAPFRTALTDWLTPDHSIADVHTVVKVSWGREAVCLLSPRSSPGG